VHPQIKAESRTTYRAGASQNLDAPLFSRGAAREGSPRRKPWEGFQAGQAAEQRKKLGSVDLSRAPPGAFRSFGLFPHGLRRGLPSAAAPQLSGNVPPQFQKMRCARIERIERFLLSPPGSNATITSPANSVLAAAPHRV
jgi:hypothetical protein